MAIPFMNDIAKKMTEYLEGGAENLDELDAKEVWQFFFNIIINSKLKFVNIFSYHPSI